MMKETVYIAGPISGRDINEAREAFACEALKLEKRGYKPVNPFDLGTSADHSWAENMKICIAEMVHCDYIYMLPGWMESQGALMEYDISCKLEIPELIINH